MLKSIRSDEHKTLSLEDYSADAKFAVMVETLKVETTHLKQQLSGRTIWMVNSTAEGGGVAEMMPRLMGLMNELGAQVRWAVITTQENAFFDLTKRIHNLVHGDRRVSRQFTAADREIYEAVNRTNFESIRSQIHPHDIVVIHDPQPLPLGHMTRH